MSTREQLNYGASTLGDLKQRSNQIGSLTGEPMQSARSCQGRAHNGKKHAAVPSRPFGVMSICALLDTAYVCYAHQHQACCVRLRVKSCLRVLVSLCISLVTLATLAPLQHEMLASHTSVGDVATL